MVIGVVKAVTVGVVLSNCLAGPCPVPVDKRESGMWQSAKPSGALTAARLLDEAPVQNCIYLHGIVRPRATGISLTTGILCSLARYGVSGHSLGEKVMNIQISKFICLSRSGNPHQFDDGHMWGAFK